jgi:hypothetical protein
LKSPHFELKPSRNLKSLKKLGGQFNSGTFCSLSTLAERPLRKLSEWQVDQMPVSDRMFISHEARDDSSFEAFESPKMGCMVPFIARHPSLALGAAYIVGLKFTA